MKELRPDFLYIEKLISEQDRILDIGCGSGDLMSMLKQKGARVQGIEKVEAFVISCVKKGLLVHHGDIDDGLEHHLDQSFDWVIINQTIQQTLNPGKILRECLRIGKKTIVVFPNFSHWQIRFHILISGKTPVTELMPFHWFDTPNLHFLSAKDFQEFCEKEKIKIFKKAFFHQTKEIKILPHWLSSLALFIIADSN